MARKQLTPEQRQIIVTLSAEGYSQRQIEAKTGVAKSTVQGVLKRYRETGTVRDKPGRGPKRKTSARQDRHVTRQIRRDRHLSAEAVAGDSRSLVGVEVSASTVRRRMREQSYGGCIARRKPRLRAKHIKERLQFAKAHINEPMEFWRKVIWSDESRFTLFGSDGRPIVWRQPHEEFNMECVQPVVRHGGGSVMVWACFSAGGVGELSFIDGTLNSAGYRGILERHLHRSATVMGLGDGFTLQQDNSSSHWAPIVCDYFQRNDIRVLEWPSNSPDLNPIENLWSILGREVAKKRASTEEELKQHLQDAWNALDRGVLDNLVASIPARLAEVIKNKGGYSGY
jgi:transposase